MPRFELPIVDTYSYTDDFHFCASPVTYVCPFLCVISLFDPLWFYLIPVCVGEQKWLLKETQKEKLPQFIYIKYSGKIHNILFITDILLFN